MDDDVEALLRVRWSFALQWSAVDPTWVYQLLHPIVAAAAADPVLQRLFPFTSLNRLCFSRSSKYPYTFDCPCIAANREQHAADRGRYTVLATWEHSLIATAPILAETDDPIVAVSVVVKHLPADPSVWICSAAGG